MITTIGCVDLLPALTLTLIRRNTLQRWPKQQHNTQTPRRATAKTDARTCTNQEQPNARVWREGCIIRSGMLNDMATALEDDPARGLLLAPYFVGHLKASGPGLRSVVSMGAAHGLPLPALSAGLAWFDMMRTGRSTANMIQAQRDFFGAHGFERLDRPGTGLHGPWGSHH